VEPRLHPHMTQTREQRARGHPRLAEDKSVHAKIQTREFEKPEVRGSSYSGSATKPALFSVNGRFAEAPISGARPSAARASLMVKMLSMYSPKGAGAFSQRGARAITGARLNIEIGNRRGGRHAVRAWQARI
ncbi:MAG: hypothetical protein WBW81_04020, partial [Methylocella sp.]